MPTNQRWVPTGNITIVLVTMEVNEGKKQEALNSLIPLGELARKRQGNIDYDIYSSTENPNDGYNPAFGAFGSDCATAISSSRINLDWNNNTEADLFGYNVYRSSTSGGPYGLIYGGVTTSAYADTGLSALTTYYYVVTAVDSSGNESFSRRSAWRFLRSSSAALSSTGERAEPVPTSAASSPSASGSPESSPVSSILGFVVVIIILGGAQPLFLGGMLGLFGQQRIAIGLRDLIIVGMDFAEGQEAVAISAIVDERRLQRRFDAGDLG